MLKYILILSMAGHPDFIVPRLFHEIEHCAERAATVKDQAAKVVPPTFGQITHECYPIIDGD
jgi:hypothetical protein